MMPDQLTTNPVAAQSLLDRANLEPPLWAGKKILAWDDAEFRRLEPFITATYWCDQESINVHRVIGTQHPDYQGKTWLEFLNGGKRMDINLPLHRSNPGYYLDTERKLPSMHYVSLDGLSYYVSVDGNHRSCIAKFDFHYNGRTMLHGVTVVRHQVDRAFYQYYRALTGYARATSCRCTSPRKAQSCPGKTRAAGNWIATVRDCWWRIIRKTHRRFSTVNRRWSC